MENKRDTHSKNDTREVEKGNTETQVKDTEEETLEKETKGREEEKAQPRDPQEGQSSTENVAIVDSWDIHREHVPKQEKGSREIATHVEYRDTQEYSALSSHMGEGKEREE